MGWGESKSYLKPGRYLRNNNFLAILVTFCFCLIPIINCASKAEYNSEGIPPSLRNILTEDLRTYEAPRWIQEEYPYFLSGYDQYNRPIWILNFGKWDILKVIKKGGKDFEDFDKYLNQCFYRTMATRIRKLTIPNNMPANETIKENEVTMIYDLNNYPASQVGSPKVVAYLRKKLKQVKPTYEHANFTYAINLSKTGRALVSLMKPTMGDLYYKAEFYGTNRDQWLPVLQKSYPRDQLPEYYGGVYNHSPISLSI